MQQPNATVLKSQQPINSGTLRGIDTCLIIHFGINAKFELNHWVNESPRLSCMAKFAAITI